MGNIDSSRIRSIEVFHLNQLGDLVFSLPALAALRAGFPGARITSVVPAGLAGLICPSPWLDACITHRGAMGFLSTLRRVRRAEPELAICFSQSPRVMLLAAASGAAERVGFAGGALSGLLTRQVDKSTIPSLANNLRLVESLGCAVERRDYRHLLRVEEEDRRLAERLLAEDGVSAQAPLVVVGASASSRRREKEWPIGRFRELAHGIAERHGIEVVFVGAEPQLGEPGGNGVHDLGGRTTLRCLMGMLERSELFVGIDSGVLHLAAALGTPCVALFGPTDPAITGPCGDEHLVLHPSEAAGGLAELAVGPVAQAVDRHLAELTG